MATPINKLLKFLKISDEDEEEVSEDTSAEKKNVEAMIQLHPIPQSFRRNH